MDDKFFDQWSNALLDLRQVRQGTVKNKIQEKGSAYTAQDLFDYCMSNLDQILIRWWEFEKQSWETTPPGDSTLALDNLKAEVDTLIDFEIEAMNQEIAELSSHMSWKQPDIEQGNKDLTTFASDLKKNYYIKIDGLQIPPEKKKMTAAANATMTSFPSKNVSKSGGGGNSATSLMIMFFLGLGLGSVGTVYFRDRAIKAETRLEDERASLQIQQKSFLNNMTVLQEAYYQLAKGKLMSLPELDKAMEPINAAYAQKKKKVEEDFVKSKESLMKRIPAGDRLDQAIKKAEETKATQLRIVDEQRAAQLEPYMKQKKIHEELMKE